jgi:hypothetical protein
MKSGVHQQSLVDALSEANQILILKPENQDWDIDALFSKDSLLIAIAGSVGFIMIGTGIEGVTSGLGFIHIKALLSIVMTSIFFILIFIENPVKTLFVVEIRSK